MFHIGQVLKHNLFLQGYRHTGDLPRNTPWYFDRVRSGDNIVARVNTVTRAYAASQVKRVFVLGNALRLRSFAPSRTDGATPSLQHAPAE